MLPEKSCVKCGKLFRPRASRPNQRFCSLQCCGRAKVIAKPTFVCEGCGATRERRRFRMADGRELGYDYSTRFCSKECGYRGRKTRPINPNGHVHAGTGYMRVNLGRGEKDLLHRIVMKKHLGRDLYAGENIHHKDGDRKNNALDNLELWSTKQPTGQRVADKIAFAIEMLLLYPEFARQAGYVLHEVQLSAAPALVRELPSAPPAPRG